MALLRFPHSSVFVRFRSVHNALVLVTSLALLVALQAVAQSIPAQYLNALQRARYQIYSGDVNGDGLIDVMAKAAPRIVLIDFDVSIPIPLKPTSPTFVLLSTSGGSYVLENNPSSARINHSAWQPQSHDLVFGDVIGTGNNAMLLRARTSGEPSFLIVTSPSNGAPVLLQELSTSALGTDISGSSREVELRDQNRDGRADLLVRAGGAIVAVLLAGPDGTFARAPQDDSTSVLMAWRVFCAQLDEGDLNGALANMASASRVRYGSALVAMGTAITGLSQNWVEAEVAEVRSSYAVLSVVQNLGERLQHQVVFVREDGRWLVHDL